jgi:hypothetical protein
MRRFVLDSDTIASLRAQAASRFGFENPEAIRVQYKDDEVKISTKKPFPLVFHLLICTFVCNRHQASVIVFGRHAWVASKSKLQFEALHSLFQVVSSCVTASRG